MTRPYRAAILAALLTLAPAAPVLAATCPAPSLALASGGGRLPIAQAALRAGGPIVILAIGSSTTAGVGAGGQGFAQSLGPLLQERVGRPVRVIVSGVLAETAAGAHARMAGEIAAHRPHLVLWQLGTNDANFGVGIDRFRAALRAGVQAARAARVDLALVDPQHSRWAEGGEATAAIAAAVAAEGAAAGLPVVRRFAAMRAIAVRDRPLFDRLIAWDGLHLSAAGHACLAAQTAATLARALGR